MNPAITLGGNGTGSFFKGVIDEVQISTLARPVDWLKLSARSQSPDFTVVSLGGDEAKESGSDSSFGVIIANVTIDGWVVIGLTGIMFVMAMVVMTIKIIVLRRVRKDNLAFLAAYEALSADSDIASLDHEETEEEKAVADSELLTAIAGDHTHYQSSPLYHLYHTGIREMNKRIGATNRPLSSEAMQVIQTALDAILVRETQRLNSKMVLLSISIAGGPYLGLLGTVVGVMITFAVIAASGDVNINAIAPGIAAALLATVAGLAVAIPALFAYNYLTVQIKDVIADMRVFSDEFLAMLAEKSADRFRVD
jgi:biopolymer transport protein ExbB